MAIGIAEDTTSASHEYWCRLVATHLGRKRSLEARSVSLACVLPVSLACLNSQTSVVREAPVDRDSTWCANGIQCASRKVRCFRQQGLVASSSSYIRCIQPHETYTTTPVFCGHQHRSQQVGLLQDEGICSHSHCTSRIPHRGDKARANCAAPAPAKSVHRLAMRACASEGVTAWTANAVSVAASSCTDRMTTNKCPGTMSDMASRNRMDCVNYV